MRCFLAFDLDEAALTACGRVQTKLDSSWRAVPSANLHLTLVFMPFLPSVEHLEEARDLQFSSIELHLKNMLVWPEKRAGRLAVVKVEAFGNVELAHQALVHSIRPWLEARDLGRPFTPHVTIARSKSGVSSLVRHSTEALSVEHVAWQPDAIHLYESRLGGPASHYIRRRSWPLPR